jgi:hypothetical protein
MEIKYLNSRNTEQLYNKLNELSMIRLIDKLK